MDTRSSCRQSKVPASEIMRRVAKSVAEVKRVRKDVVGDGAIEIAQCPRYGSTAGFLALRRGSFSALGGALTAFDSGAVLRGALRALAGARWLPPPRAPPASHRPTASSGR